MSNKEQRKAPVLRFKGFTDDWEQQKLEKFVISDQAGKYIKKEKLGKGINYIGVQNLYDRDFIDKNDKFRLAPISESKYLLHKNDLLYAESSLVLDGIAKTIYVKELSAPLSFAWHTRKYTVKTQILPGFLVYDLNYKNHHNLTNKATQTALVGITKKDYFGINIKFPNIQEQNKILDILIKITNLISLQQRKLDQLKQLKKAYLSDLFSIKNKPQIRFKGFKGKWKKSKLLDNVSNIIDFRGKTPKKLGMDWSDQGILALSALNVKDGFIDKSIHAHYGDIKLYNKWMAGNKLHKGQVLFTTEAPMGNVAQVPDNDKYILSQRTIAFNVNKDKISDSFLAMLLQTTTVHNQLLSLSSGGTAKGVSQKSLSGLSVAIPLSLEEQRKMEMTFKYINHLIHFQQDKIRYLEENKQFLLQNMFI